MIMKIVYQYEYTMRHEQPRGRLSARRRDIWASRQWGGRETNDEDDLHWGRPMRLNPTRQQSAPVPLPERPTLSGSTSDPDAPASAPASQPTAQPGALTGSGATEAGAGSGMGPSRARPDSALPQTQGALAAQIDQLTLDGLQKAYLRDRWLDQTTWLGRSARRNQRRHYTLRLITILGGVAIPALVGLEINNNESVDAIRWLTFGLGLLVAAAAALEEFFRYGERWRHYRRHAELLKAEGWAFLQLVGPAYTTVHTHAEAFRTFVGRVEETMRQEVGVYITEVTRVPDQEGRIAKAGSSVSAAKPIAGAEGPGTAVAMEAQ
jgi:hypothetical protein